MDIEIEIEKTEKNTGGNHIALKEGITDTQSA